MATSTLGNGTLVLAGTTSGTTTVTATAVAGTTTLTLPAATDTLVGKATTDTLTNKTLTGAAMNGTLGATTPSTVAATTLTTSSTVTHNGGTANGVAYLNGSKVLTTGSALVFDSSSALGVGTSTPTSTYSARIASLAAAGTTALALDAPTGTNTSINFYYNGTAKWTTQVLTTGEYRWYDFVAGSERMRLDTSGNLLVGTTFSVTNATIAALTGIGFNTASFGSGGRIYVTSVGSGSHNMIFSTRSGGDVNDNMRLDSSGNLLVGTTSGGGERLYVTQSASSSTAFFLNNNGTAANQYGIVVKLNGDPNNTNHMVQCLGGATERATIRANGGLANYSANNVNLSDRREKTNFAPAKSYLDVICAIPVQTFNYIDQNLEEDSGLTLGVVAQDVQAVAPEMVMESNWGTEEEPKMRLSIYQTDLQYALMKCIQEQQALITQLTARITALESA